MLEMRLEQAAPKPKLDGLNLAAREPLKRAVVRVELARKPRERDACSADVQHDALPVDGRVTHCCARHGSNPPPNARRNFVRCPGAAQLLDAHRLELPRGTAREGRAANANLTLPLDVRPRDFIALGHKLQPPLPLRHSRTH